MEELDKSTVVRAGQRPAIFAFVPLNFFLVEAMVALLLFRALEFWAAIFLPVHLYFVIKTGDDPHWLTSLKAWWKFKFGVINKGIYGKDVITFTASPIKAGKKDYADFQ
jgi:type IV secretory pathway VirB3-like protein